MRLTRAHFFSVRDEKSLSNVSAFDKSRKVKLVPDTAILMEHYYAKSRVKELISEYIKELDLCKMKYFVLQVNRFDGKKYRRHKLADVISRIYDELGISCVLLPIGRAAFHEDQVPLKKISRLSKK